MAQETWVSIPNQLPPHYARLHTAAERDPRCIPVLHRVLTHRPISDPLDQAWITYLWGWSWLCRQHSTPAQFYLTRAQALFQRQHHRYGQYLCQHARFACALLQCQQTHLERSMQTLLNACTADQIHDIAQRTALDLARLYIARGHPTAATQVLDHLRMTITQASPLISARWQYLQGVIAIYQHDHTQAYHLLQQAVTHCTTLRAYVDLARCWFYQGWHALRREQLANALTAYQRAANACAMLELPLDQALCARDLGVIYMMQGAYPEAVHHTLTAWQLSSRLGRLSEMGACHLHLGNIAFYTGQWELALTQYQRAAAIYRRTDLTGRHVVALRNQAMVYRAQGQHAAAHQTLNDVIRQAQGLGLPAEVAEAQMVRAGVWADTGHHTRAIQGYQLAWHQFRQLHHHPAVAECRLEQGWLLLQQGQLQLAQICFHTALPALVHHPQHHWRLDYGLARCAAGHQDWDLAIYHYRRACRTVATQRQRLCSEVASSALATQAQPLYTDALRVAMTHGAGTWFLEFYEGQRALILQQLLTSRSAARSVDAQHVPSLPASVSRTQLHTQLQRTYGQEWTVLVYLIQDETLYIGVLTPRGGWTFTTTPFDKTLQDQIQQVSQPRYRTYVYHDIPTLCGHATQPWAILQALGQRLIPVAVRARLHADHRLVIVPAGPLHGVPWAALRLADSWLIEQAIIQVVPSLTIYQQLATRPLDCSRPALLLGCGSTTTPAPTLPGVAHELLAVASQWSGATVLAMDHQVTRTSLLKTQSHIALNAYGVIHLACHAQLLPNRGRDAHVQVWDGPLTLTDIRTLPLAHPLVVLSSCDGAATAVLPGEEIFSLSWAFLAAGAIGVLASRWPVYDRTTIPLLTLFYATLRSQYDPAQALALTQRQLIRHYQATRDPSMAPAVWSSFVWIGGGC